MDSVEARKVTNNDAVDTRPIVPKLYESPNVPLKESLYFEMNHRKRGTAIIFNHEFFEVANLPSRSGTGVDCQRLVKCLKNLKFDVQDYHNLPQKQVAEITNKAATANHKDCDCFIMVILTHGEYGMLYAKDSPYKPNNLWEQFTADKCPSLAGKPKMFFIQACQGDKLDPGIIVRRTETDGSFDMSYTIPTYADFLIAYSTIPGFYSWRNTTNGSWFIQALVTELEIHGKSLDLLTLLTLVCQRVAINFESNTPGNPAMHQQKQIPCITTMLTRLVRFSNK